MGGKQCDTTKRLPDTDSAEAERKWLLDTVREQKERRRTEYTVGKVADTVTLREADLRPPPSSIRWRRIHRKVRLTRK